MQATFIKRDDNIVRRGREKSTLEGDYLLAEQVLGEKTLLSDETHGDRVMMNLLRNLRDSHGTCFVWSVELIVMLFVIMAMVMELWGACAFEMDVAPVCKYCYTEIFVLWSAVFVALWFLNLCVYVLLVSRGFSLGPHFISHIYMEAEAKGIPPSPISLFFCLTGGIVAWLVVGLVIVISSNSCATRGMIFSMSSPGRSELMFGTTIIALAATPLLLVLGRPYICQMSPVSRSDVNPITYVSDMFPSIDID